MKKFVLKTSLFTIILMFCLAFLEYYIFPISNNQMGIKKNLLDKKINVEGIVLGNSHTFFGINPDESEFKMINVANLGRKLETDFYILRNYYKNQQKLKFVIIPISSYTLLSKELSSNEKRLYYNFFNIEEYSQPLLKNYLLFNEPFKELIDNVIFGNKNLHNKKITSLGWRSNLGQFIKDPKDNKERVKDLEGHFSINNNEINRNLFFLNKIIKLSVKNDFKVILITPPYHPFYYSLSNKKYYNYLNNLLLDVSSKFENTVYIEGKSLNMIDNDVFFNLDHLNTNGAKIFTKKIDSILKINL